MVVAALLHDIGDILAAHNHPELAATILRPYVRPSTHWVVAKHGIFEGYFYFHHYGQDRLEREKYRGHPAFEKAVEFCLRWDQASFDPAYDTMPISSFVGAVHRVFDREPWSLCSSE
jgi:predicted HD phosphohydrolase